MKFKPYVRMVFVFSVFGVSTFWLTNSLAQKPKAIPSPAKEVPKPTKANTPPPPPGPVIIPPSCCGTKPPLTGVPNYSTTYGLFTGAVAVATEQALTANDPVVVIWDLANQATALTGGLTNQWWTTTSNPATHFYSHSSWTRQNLGDVFGLTLDDAGNIYVASSTSFNSSHPVGSGGGHGDIYKLNALSGNATVFVHTDTNAATYGNNNKIPNTGPGLGNIHYNCQYKRFYVSNFEDGAIYSIDLSGVIKSVWDHGQHTTPQVLDDGLNGFTALGRRPVGLATANGRLYYSNWCGMLSNNLGQRQNEIWSVQLNANGDITGNPTLEITLPVYPGGTPPSSSPVFDLAFGPTGRLLAAERDMIANSSVAAHSARVLEYAYAWNGTAWAWILTSNNYQIGAYNTKNNAAGGCSYDWGTTGLMWATGDAIHFPGWAGTDYIYGIQGTPTSGTPLDITRSLLIDLNNNVSSQNKMQLGDVQISCPGCSAAAAKKITCKTNGSIGYDLNLTITNNTGVPISHILLTPPPNSDYTFAQQNIATSIPNQASVTLPVTILGGHPNENICFSVTFMSREACECTVNVCAVLPSCGSAQATCNNGTYIFAPTITNNCGSAVQYIYLYAPPNTTITPDHFTITQTGGLPHGGTYTTPPLIITGAQPGSFCYDVSFHGAGMQDCCRGTHQCITLPSCGPNNPNDANSPSN